MAEIIKKEQPGGVEWICSECKESVFQGTFAVSKNVPYQIHHRMSCSAHAAPTSKQFPHELAEEDYRRGRSSEGNSDTL